MTPRKYLMILACAAGTLLFGAGNAQENDDTASADEAAPAEQRPDRRAQRPRRRHMSEEERAAARERWQDMSEEEREAKREEMRARRDARKARPRRGERADSAPDE